MNIIIAIDSFKGSLSSLEAGRITADSAKEIYPQAEIRIFPLADGGEGTLDALTAGMDGRIIATEVTGPLGNRIASRYGVIESSRLAIIEMADAAGITLVTPNKRNPLNTTTYGLGELILQAAGKGCREFIIGIGGSATNDCGIGMLTALGAKFTKSDGTPASITGSGVGEVSSIDISELNPVLKECRFRIACDVTNPLYGPNGCSEIYGPQKGATPETVVEMDTAIRTFAEKAASQLGITGAELPGAGAAGGLGYAFHAFLNGTLEPGVDLILDSIGIKEALVDADLVITGEGCLDEQTAMGKAPTGISKLAKSVNPKIQVIALCGCAKPEAVAVNDHGIDAYFPILHMPMNFSKATQPEVAERNLSQTVSQIFRLIRSTRAF